MFQIIPKMKGDLQVVLLLPYFVGHSVAFSTSVGGLPQGRRRSMRGEVKHLKLVHFSKNIY